MADIRMCDECGIRPAVYYETNMINGMVTERYLCEECKKKHGFVKTSVPDLFDGFFAALTQPLGMFGEPVRENRVCPTCGCTAESYTKTGFLGCPDCYKTFEPLIMRSVAKLQKDVKHTGKTPTDARSPEELKYNELLKKREEAVAVEDFQLAAKINDEMKKLKGGAK